MNIHNAVTVITGASEGIGEATARVFSKNGAKVVLAARSIDKITKVADELGNQCIAVETDVTRPYDIKRLTEKTIERFGRLDILINNAGIGLSSEITSMDPNDLTQLLEVNLFGPLYAIQAAVPLMKKQGKGIIINVSSMITSLATVRSGGYRASKLALEGLGDAVRLELAPQNIKVVTIFPGLTSTSFFENSLGNSQKGGFAKKHGHFRSADFVANKILQGAQTEKREIYMSKASKIKSIIAFLFSSQIEWLYRRI